MLVLPDALDWPVYGRKAYRWIMMKEFDEPAPGRGVLAPYIGLYLQGDVLAEQDALIDEWSLAGEEHPEPTRTYMPLDGNHPTLFLQFAATPPTKQGILGFIDKFGILGLSYSSKIGGDRLVGVEPIEVWETEITTLRDCLAYWQSIRHGEFISSRKTQSIESSYKGLQEFFKETPLKNTPYSIKYFVLDKICAHIHINCEFEPSAVVNSDDSGIDFAIKPTNLLAAIWLQFVGAICTDVVYGTCGYCGEVFKAKRKSARYCSESHRQMAYRKRKEIGK